MHFGFGFNGLRVVRGRVLLFVDFGWFWISSAVVGFGFLLFAMICVVDLAGTFLSDCVIVLGYWLMSLCVGML